MKRIFIFSLLMIAFVMNAVAWEPVIKETHWFGSIEYDENIDDPNDNYGGLNISITWDNNSIKNIRGYARNHQGASFGWGDRHWETTFYCWQDDSESSPKPRFRVNVTNNWEVGRNNSNKYHGIGLKVKESVGSTNGTNFWIQNLDAGDKFVIEYYRVANATRMPFLVSGNVTGRTNTNDWSTESEIAGGPEYECPSGGEVCINIPGGTVIRGVTIIHSSNCYKKATTKIEQIRDEDNNIGYEMTLTGSGVLEDKRGAVPYITMRFGDMNDMTYVKYLGTFNGEKKYGASSIVDETDDLNPTNQNLQQVFKDHGEDWTKKKLIGKEWTVFTNNRDILPLYGTYYYFFPEVDGKFNVKFYCEGDLEHLPLWYKFDANDGIVPFNDQLHLEMKRNGVTINSGDDDGKFFIGGNTKYDEPYYEYTVEFKKGGVYYLCSNPNNYGQERPILRLISYGFIPTFRVDPLYKVVGNGTPSVSGAATIKGVTIDKFDGINNVNGEYVFNNDATVTINGEDAPMIKCLGNIKKDGTVIKLRQDGNDIKLDFQKIAYKEGDDINKGGAIVVNLECPAGEAGFVLTVAYDAADAKWNADGTLRVPASVDGTQVKRWDFYSGKGEKDELGTGQGWDLGKYGTVNDADKSLWETDFNSWKQKSKLFKEVNKYGGLTADWVDTYVNLTDGRNERFFKSVYDMEGDNADMIHETEGLVFLTHANQLGILNENANPTDGFQDRYIGLMPGSKFTIPLLDAGDRIVLKIGTYNNEDVTLNITGANDAINTGISSDYIIGGSIPVSDDVTGADDKYYPRGEYHFVAKGGDATFEVTSGQMLKIYSIDIYKNNEILTENQLVGDLTEVTFTDDDAANATKTIDAHVRYHGYQETSKFDDVDQLRGNISYTKNDFTVTTSTDEPYCTISTTVNNGDFGSFRAKMEVLTKDDDNTYVTDYVPGSLAVDYLKKVKDGYPYTWDFTDLLQIKNTGDTYIDNSISTERDATSLLPDYKGWKDVGGTHSLRNAPENASGVLFANGGQLYGAALSNSDGMFKEIAGIGFKRSTETPEEAKLLNESLGIKSGAIELNSGKDGVFYKLVIPKVDKDAAIYVRATPVKNATLLAKYSTDGTTGNLFSGDNAKTLTADGGDKIYVVRNTAEQDVELWLDGMSIKKIAVATDLKTVNDLGWNTESRGYTTDPSLLSYMTGKDFRTYVVLKPNEDEGEEPISVDKPVTLTRIDGGSKDGDATGIGMSMIIGAAEENGSPNACIVRYVGTKGGEDIFDEGEGFHIFVPDMHDGPSVLSDNLLKAQVKSGTVLRNETIEGTTYNNYAFTNKWKYVDSEGNELTGRGGQKVGDQAFYRIMKDGATSANGNQAYLSIEGTDAARLAIFIEDEEYDGEATGIATMENIVNDENGRFYNLNGQQLSGKPNRSGLYIVNGKKVSIKNK